MDPGEKVRDLWWHYLSVVYVCRDSDGGFSFIHHLWRLWNEGPESFVQDLHSLVNSFGGLQRLLPSPVWSSCSLSCQAWDHQNQQQEQMSDHDSIEELRAMKSQRKTQPMPCSVTSNSVYLASYSFWLFIWTTHAHAPFFKQPWTWNGWVWDCLYLQQCYAQHFGRTSHAGRLCKICQQWSQLSMMNLASLVSSRRSRKMLRMCSASTIFHRHKHSRTLV